MSDQINTQIFNVNPDIEQLKNIVFRIVMLYLNPTKEQWEERLKHLAALELINYKLQIECMLSLTQLYGLKMTVIDEGRGGYCLSRADDSDPIYGHSPINLMGEWLEKNTKLS